MISSTAKANNISPHPHEGGFTLVETLVAVAVMGTAIVALLSALSTGSIAVTIVEEKVTASGVARSQLEYTQSLSFQVAPTTYATITTPEGYSVTADAFPVDGADSDIQEIAITVYHHVEEVLVVQGYKMNR